LRDSDTLALKVTYFDSELWDVNSFVDTTPAQTLLDEIQTQGLEFEASYAMENGFYVDLNATISDGEEVDALGGVRDWRNLAANSLRATVGKVFDDTYDLSWEVVSAESITVNGVRDEGYTVHNLRATIAPKRGVWEGTEFRVGIENLLDEQYIPNLATRPAVGRNFKLTLAKTF
jgi:hemoglobin/transferrin/lactoferrin receptor protein